MLVAGYGLDNTGFPGTLNFGYAQLDGVDREHDRFVDSGSLAGVGHHLVNLFDTSWEVAIDSGDSGGPDFAASRLKIDNKWYWVPEIVGVHSFGDDSNGNGRTDRGEETWSVQLTPDVVAQIKQAIPRQLRQVARFDIHVMDDSESGPGDTGEWRATLVVNGMAFAFDRNVADGEWVTFDPPYALLGNNTLEIGFSGYEEDGGLFNGKDDTIPALNTTVAVPNLLLGNGLRIKLGEEHGSAAYELFVRFEWSWV